MTCIVGLVGTKGVLIAGDAQGSTEWTKREDAGVKVFNLMDTVAMGYCGSGRFGQILQYHMDDLDEPPLAMDEHRWAVHDFIPYLRALTEEHGHLHVRHNVEEFGPSAFLLGVRGRLFAVWNDFSVDEHVHPYEAIGSGGETAMGVLHAAYGETREPLYDRELLEVATGAIEAAKMLTPFVGGEISHVQTVRWTDDEKTLAREILAE